jgi:CheY-like chemotaxis protein
MLTTIVIDDDIDTVEVFCEYLELKNALVLGKGYNGKDAVELYKKHLPDVVFLDLMMPQYDGIYALENIRKINPLARVIVITADMRRETEEELDKLEPTAVFIKPFNIDKIMQTLSKI